MNLYQQIEEEEKELGLEPEVEEQEEEEAESPAIDEPEVEKQEEPKEEEKPKDAYSFVQMRKEKREKEQEIERLRKELEEAKKPKEEPKQPDRETDYEAWLEWRDQQTEARVAAIEANYAQERRQREAQQQWQAAVNEFQQYENNFKQRVPDYDDAAEFFNQQMKNLAVLENPTANEAQINAIVAQKILVAASRYAELDLDPAEQLYKLTKERFGFQPKQEQKSKPNLQKIASNQKKSASPISGGGSPSKGELSADAVANMTLGEFSRLTPEQLRKLEGY